MDVILTDAGAPSGSITYRTTGGILDLLFFAGPTPLHVSRDVSASLGYPALPPYWGLGFHLCRWGYKDINETAAVVAAMRAAKLPHDVMWNDIDYMSEYLDFTSDAQRYPMHQMRALVDDLHAHGQHYVMITDPGISSTQPHGTYPPLDEGIAGDVFINVSGKPLVGKVWPGGSACAALLFASCAWSFASSFLLFCSIAISNFQTSLTMSQV
jgi:lysosomal alpha-glucosidase